MKKTTQVSNCDTVTNIKGDVSNYVGYVNLKHGDVSHIRGNVIKYSDNRIFGNDKINDFSVTPQHYRANTGDNVSIVTKRKLVAITFLLAISVLTIAATVAILVSSQTM